MVLIVSMAAEMRGVASNPLLALYNFWLHRKIGRGAIVIGFVLEFCQFPPAEEYRP